MDHLGRYYRTSPGSQQKVPLQQIMCHCGNHIGLAKIATARLGWDFSLCHNLVIVHFISTLAWRCVPV